MGEKCTMMYVMHDGYQNQGMLAQSAKCHVTVCGADLASSLFLSRRQPSKTVEFGCLFSLLLLHQPYIHKFTPSLWDYENEGYQKRHVGAISKMSYYSLWR